MWLGYARFNIKGNKMTDLDLVDRAQRYARHHHEGQLRKGEAAEPYITHVAEVALLVRALEGDAIAQSAAWLHDVVEDCSPTLMDVEEEFGAEIAAVVAEVTDDKSLEKEQRKARQVESAATKSDRACLIKWADKTSNLNSIAKSPPPWSRERKIEYIDWACRVTERLPFRPVGAEEFFNSAAIAARESLET